MVVEWHPNALAGQSTSNYPMNKSCSWGWWWWWWWFQLEGLLSTQKHLWRSEDYLQESILSSYYVESWGLNLSGAEVTQNKWLTAVSTSIQTCMQASKGSQNFKLRLQTSMLACWLLWTLLTPPSLPGSFLPHGLPFPRLLLILIGPWQFSHVPSLHYLGVFSLSLSLSLLCSLFLLFLLLSLSLPLLSKPGSTGHI